MQEQNFTYDANSALRRIVAQCIGEGERINIKGVGSSELINYQIKVIQPRGRITTLPQRPLNVVVALARFVWLIGGNDRVQDIAYYEPKVAGFSDNGLSVPGSNYGARLVQPRPGLNQINGIIDRLRVDSTTRQASAVVWQPEDAVRISADIPCCFGMFFTVRNCQLDMTVVMRSNNAFRILPFNMFEFTMLQEIVASEIDMELGDFTVFAHNMHVLLTPGETANINGLSDDFLELKPLPRSPEMRAMPAGNVSNFDQAQQLAQLEAQLRHCSSELEFQRIVAVAQNELEQYWFDLFVILARFTKLKKGYADSLVRSDFVADRACIRERIIYRSLKASFPDANPVELGIAEAVLSETDKTHEQATVEAELEVSAPEDDSIGEGSFIGYDEAYKNAYTYEEIAENERENADNDKF